MNARRMSDSPIIAEKLSNKGRAALRLAERDWRTTLAQGEPWVLDADIRGFFDGICHEWLEKYIEHGLRIGVSCGPFANGLGQGYLKRAEADIWRAGANAW